MLKTRNRLNKILADNTGQTLETIQNDTERDNYMTAEEARRLRPGRPHHHLARGCAEHRRVEKRTGYMNDRRDDEFEGRDADIACAFCGKQPHQVAAMISGPNGIYICDECISVCADAMMRDLG